MPSVIDPSTMPSFAGRGDEGSTQPNGVSELESMSSMPSFVEPAVSPAVVVEETADVITTTIRFEAYMDSSSVPDSTPMDDSAGAIEGEIDRIVSNHRRSDLMTSDAWDDWRQLRDYVCASIEARCGAFPRNPVKEKAIFSSFFDRWGDKAEGIARYAVEVHNCWWANAPLSVNRFCKGSDPFFAEVIARSI